ncbi:MAG: hypothetical protein CSA62_10880 [Planctomycetota bacterium]|nr:MAG: hypothetical protein CSA62_10880 [Planctomycetota bacterium]
MSSASSGTSKGTLCLGLYGTGRLATAMLRSLRGSCQLHLRARDLVARDRLAAEFGVQPWEAGASPDLDLVYFAVADAAVPELGLQLDAELPEATAFVHASGAWGPELFGDLPRRLGQLHPLRSLQAGARLQGTRFVARAPGELAPVLETLVAQLGGSLRLLQQLDTALYHAAAAMLANGVTALFAEALELFQRASGGELTQEDAHGLLQTVCEGLAERSPEAVLTGPVRRADLGVVERHLAALGEGEAAALYRQLSLSLVRLAARAGSDAEPLRRIAERLRQD